jgi:hypothetical protein
MAEDALIPIFGSPAGINTVDGPKSERFQPGGETKPFLTRAENVDLDRTGGLRTRAGYTKLRALTDGHSGWAGSVALYADGGSLYQFNPNGTDTLLTTGMDPHAEISYAELPDGQVLWCNGSQHGRVAGGQNLVWGIEAQGRPALAATTGNLPAGTYQVAVTTVDGELEGGYSQAASITLTETSGIQVTPANVVSDFNLYLSDTNGADLYYHSSNATTITDLAATTYLSQHQGVYPPPAGHLVRVWGGYVLVAFENGLYVSEPGAPHRFRLATDFQAFGSRIVLVEPLPDGVYVALESGGTFWIEGTSPADWRVRQVDDRLVAEGAAARVMASRLPWAESQLEVMVPVWTTQDGFVAGLPGGVLRAPQASNIAMDAHKKASVAYVERPNLRQLLTTLREKTMGSRVRSGDQLSITATRGGVPL